jgi:AcrR family transcriptional regulator
MGTGTQREARTSATISTRRAQITDATLALVADHGLQGATMLRIARIVGMSTAALYRYFESREAILMASYDQLADKVHEWIHAVGECRDAVAWRRLLSRHSELFSTDIKGFNAPMFQFRVYLPDDPIREHVKERTASMFAAYESMIEDCKARGIVRADVDAASVVTDLLAWMYWENLTYLSGFANESTPAKSNEMLSRVIDGVAARP